MTVNDTSSLYCALIAETIDYKRIPDTFFLNITPAVKSANTDQDNYERRRRLTN